MRKLIYFFLLVIPLFLLAWCEVWNKSDLSVKNNALSNSNPDKVSILTWTKLLDYLKQEIENKKKNLLDKNVNLSWISLVYDPKCNLPVCNVDQIKTQLAIFGLSWEIKEIDVSSNKDLVKFVTDNNITLPALFISDNVLNKLSNPNISAIISQNWYKVKNWSILSMFLWEYWKENICDDGIDNDWDGNIDVKDSDCKKAIVLYDSKCTDAMCDADQLVKWLKWSIFVIWYYIDKKDYQTEEWKKIFDNYISTLNYKYLPAIIVDWFILDEIPYSILSQDTKSFLAKVNNKYVWVLGKIWDPINWKYLQEKQSNNENFKQWTLTKDQIKEILNQWYNLWSLKDANIAWIEYSDLECPFCARQHNEGNVDYILNKFWNKLLFWFRHFPLNFHKYAKPGAVAVECVWKLTNWDVNKVYEFIKKIYKKGINDENIINIARELGINENKFKQCLKSNEFDSKIWNQMKIGQEIFNISGTPWNVFINLENWKYIVVPGAYPKEVFEQVINDLLSK